MKIKKALLVAISWLLIINLIGCEAFVKKFTRKKKGEEKEEILVIAPEEYKDTRTAEQKYRDAFDFWKSWQDELVESLLQKKSNKKIKSCADEAIKNLLEMRAMLNIEKQKALDVYIDRMKSLKKSIESDIYGNNSSTYMEKADQLKMNISQKFSYRDVAKYLI